MRLGKSLRGRNGHTVSRNDLGLVGKDFTACGIHKYLDPLNVVVKGYGGSVVSEGFNPCEVLQPPAEGVEHGPIDSRVVGVAMNVGNRLPKRHDLIAKGGKECLEAVRQEVRFNESLRVAGRSARAVGKVETGGRLAD